MSRIRAGRVRKSNHPSSLNEVCVSIRPRACGNSRRATAATRPPFRSRTNVCRETRACAWAQIRADSSAESLRSVQTFVREEILFFSIFKSHTTTVTSTQTFSVAHRPISTFITPGDARPWSVLLRSYSGTQLTGLASSIILVYVSNIQRSRSSHITAVVHSARSAHGHRSHHVVAAPQTHPSAYPNRPTTESYRGAPSRTRPSEMERHADVSVQACSEVPGRAACAGGQQTPSRLQSTVRGRHGATPPRLAVGAAALR